MRKHLGLGAFEVDIGDLPPLHGGRFREILRNTLAFVTRVHRAVRSYVYAPRLPRYTGETALVTYRRRASPQTHDGLQLTSGARRLDIDAPIDRGCASQHAQHTLVAIWQIRDSGVLPKNKWLGKGHAVGAGVDVDIDDRLPPPWGPSLVYSFAMRRPLAASSTSRLCALFCDHLATNRKANASAARRHTCNLNVRLPTMLQA